MPKKILPLRHVEVRLLLAAMVGVFLLEQWLGADQLRWLAPFATIPARVSLAWNLREAEGLSWELMSAWLSLATSIFLHADVAHLGNNLLFLWIFGSLCEDLLGRWLFPLCFLVCGIAGNLAQVLREPMSLTPVIGASGAITGLEGAYLILALRWTPPWPFVWPMSRPIPPGQLAAVGAISFFIDATSLFGPATRVALLAHLGGFVAGTAFAVLVSMRRHHHLA